MRDEIDGLFRAALGIASGGFNGPPNFVATCRSLADSISPVASELRTLIPRTLHVATRAIVAIQSGIPIYGMTRPGGRCFLAGPRHFDNDIVLELPENWRDAMTPLLAVRLIRIALAGAVVDLTLQSDNCEWTVIRRTDDWRIAWDVAGSRFPSTSHRRTQLKAEIGILFHRFKLSSFRKAALSIATELEERELIMGGRACELFQKAKGRVSDVVPGMTTRMFCD